MLPLASVSLGLGLGMLTPRVPSRMLYWSSVNQAM